MGSPLHCALLGISSTFRMRHRYDIWLKQEQKSYLTEGRRKVIDLLIEFGADLTLFHTDPRGKNRSCIELALCCSAGGGGMEHPLIKMIAAGVQLDSNLFTSFPEFFQTRTCVPSSDIGQSKQEMIAALIPLLDRQEYQDVSKLLTLFRVQDSIDASGSMDVEQFQDSLDRAIRFDQKEVVQRLSQITRFDLGMAYGLHGETALHRVSERSSHIVTDLLLSLELDVNAINSKGQTPLHLAAKWSQSAIMKTLIEHGALVTIADEEGRTVWHVAATASGILGLETLLAVDAEIKKTALVPDKDGFIPLLFAAKSSKVKACEWLINNIEELTLSPLKCPRGLGIVHYAVSMNALPLLQLLAGKGFSLNEKTTDGRNGLHFIPATIDMAIINLLFKAGLSPNTVADDGSAPLHDRMRREHHLTQSLVDVLVTQETTQMRDKNGYTVLHCAVKFSGGRIVDHAKRLASFKTLVKNGADVHARTSTGQSCLQLLMKLLPEDGEHEDDTSQIMEEFTRFFSYVVELTTDSGLLNEHLSDGAGRSFLPITWAIDQKNYILASNLFSKGVDVDLKSLGSERSSLEHAACGGCDQALFGLMLESSKSLHKLDKYGDSLVHQACKPEASSDSSLLEILCEYGFDLNLKSTKDLATPIILATEAGKKEHVNFLLRHNVNVHSRRKDGCKAFHVAASLEKFDVLECFTDFEIKWEEDLVNNPFGCNILHVATRCGRENVISFIVERSLIRDINCLDKHGWSALHHAVAFQRLGAAGVLIEKGADINVCGRNLASPMHLAIQNNDMSLLNLLLGHDCLLLPDTSGMTPEMYALKQGKPEILKRLRDYEEEKKLSANPSVDKYVEKSTMVAGLTLAIEKNDLVLCKTICDSGTNIPLYTTICYDCSPVHAALCYGRLEISRYLIDKGVSTIGQLCDSWAHRGYSAVHLASMNASASDLLPALLEQDLEAGSPAFQSLVSPIHVAVANSNTKGLEILLKHAKAHNWKDSLVNATIDDTHLKWNWKVGNYTSDQFRGYSGMDIAAQNNCASSVSLLLEYGAFVDGVDASLDKPSLIAAWNGHSQLLNLLIQSGSNINLRTIGKSGIMLALSAGLSVPTIGEGDGKHISDRSQTGQSILHLAVNKGPRSLSQLLQNGYNPYLIDNSGYTAFETAIMSWRAPLYLSLCLNWDHNFEQSIICLGSVFAYISREFIQRVLKQLLRRLPAERLLHDLNIIPTRGSIRESLLCQAARKGTPKILELLVQAGAELEFEGGLESTALLTACHEGRLSSVIHLVRMGARIFSTKHGQLCTAVQAAALFPDIIRWLLVARYTDQAKIGWEPAGNVEVEIVPWSGVVTIEFLTAGFYSPTDGASSIEKAKDLEGLRRDMLGKVAVGVRYEENKGE